MAKHTNIVSHFGTGKPETWVNGKKVEGGSNESVAVMPDGSTRRIPHGAKMTVRNGEVWIDGKKVV